MSKEGRIDFHAKFAEWCEEMSESANAVGDRQAGRDFAASARFHWDQVEKVRGE